MATDGTHWNDANGNPAGGCTQGTGFTISWQNGPLRDPGTGEKKPRNGAFVEEIIEAAVDRLNYYQASKFNCPENQAAIDACNEALHALRSRTQRREKTGIEGTHTEDASVVDES